MGGSQSPSARPRRAASGRGTPQPAVARPPGLAERTPASCTAATRVPLARRSSGRQERAPPPRLRRAARQRRPSPAPPPPRPAPGRTAPRRPSRSRRTGRGSSPAQPVRGASVAEPCGGAYHRRIRGSAAPGSHSPGGYTGHGRPGHSACVALTADRRRALRQEPRVTPLEAARHGEMPRRNPDAIPALPVRRHPAGRRLACALRPTRLAALLLRASLRAAPFAQAQDLGHELLGEDRRPRQRLRRVPHTQARERSVPGLRLRIAAGRHLRERQRSEDRDRSVRLRRRFRATTQAGLKVPAGDLVTSYAFYAPTGCFDPRGRAGVGRGFWSHQSGEDSMRTELRVNYPADAASSCSTPSHSRSRSSTRWTSASRSRWSACTCSTGVHP